jgi:hypothetical protein
VAQAIESYYPKPNAAGQAFQGDETNNYFFNAPAHFPFTKYFDGWITTSHRPTG